MMNKKFSDLLLGNISMDTLPDSGWTTLYADVENSSKLTVLHSDGRKSVLEGNAEDIEYKPAGSSINVTLKETLDDLYASKVDKITIGVPDGIASLDVSGKVPFSQLPNEYKSVITVATYADLPTENLYDGMVVFVKDATGDPSVTDGWAMYRYILSSTEWFKTTEGTSLEVKWKWEDIFGKPETFTPSTHTHTKSEVTDLTDDLDTLNTLVNGKADSVHSHAQNQVNGLIDTLTDIYTDVVSKTDIGHTHTLNDISQLSTELNNLKNRMNGIDSDFNRKSDISHTHGYAGSSTSGGPATSALECSGNASTANKLKSPVSIIIEDANGSHYSVAVPFDGSSNIRLKLPDVILTDIVGHASQDLPLTGGTLTGALTGTEATFSNVNSDLSGHADSATKAYQDGDGNVITETYLSKTGGTLTGVLYGESAVFDYYNGDLLGNANTATKLKDSVNVTITDNDSSHSSEDVAFDGTSDINLVLPDTLKVNIIGNVTGSASSCSGNSGSASKLNVGRTIVLSGPVSGSAYFDGTSDVEIALTDNIQLGVRNYFKEITLVSDDVTKPVDGQSVTIAFDGTDLQDLFFAFTCKEIAQTPYAHVGLQNESFTISFQCSGFDSDDTKVKFGVGTDDSDGQFFYIHNGKCFVTFLGNQVTTRVDSSILIDNVESTNPTTAQTVTLTKFKIEHGNKPTDWMPSTEGAGTEWIDILNKPEVFTPDAHTHEMSDIDSLNDTVNTITSDISGINEALTYKANTEHVHEMTDITGLSSALSGKSDTGHSHSISDVTDLQDALDGKSDTTHTHDYLPLDGGELSGSLTGTSATFSDNVTVDSLEVSEDVTTDVLTVNQTIVNNGVLKYGYNELTVAATLTVPVTKTLVIINDPVVDEDETVPTYDCVLTVADGVLGQALIIANMSSSDVHSNSTVYVPSGESQKYVFLRKNDGTNAWISISYGSIFYA